MRKIKSSLTTALNCSSKFCLRHNPNKMAKRNLDDAELANGKVIIAKDGPAKKKSRKDKANNSLNVDDDTNPIQIGSPEEESKEARKERRRLKKAQKAAEAIEKEQDDTLDVLDEDVRAAKAAKKAEKAKVKAIKQTNEDKAQNNPDTHARNKSLQSDARLSSSGSGYVENSELMALPEAEINTFLAENFISITDPISTSQLLRPITKFSYLPSTDSAQQAPFKSFKAPTPIQAAAWPFLLAGRDVIGVAETGSGKTMAFAVPCVRYITSIPKEKAFKGAKAVVVSPTRELAMQSYEQITKLASAAKLQVVCVYGGVPKYEQRKALETADIVVATPGRLNDLINEGSADLSKVGYVVLDEADRMLDKGFEEEIRKIINMTEPLGKRQTLMFTATWPESVRTLAATFMTSPIKIAIGDNPSGDLRANSRIVQKVEVVDPRSKEFRLLQLLKQYQSGSQKDDRILVFCLYKKEATRVESFIRSKGIRVAGIHGDLSQEQRTRSLDAFKQGTTPVLVATDVAARGLDIPAVKLVINCTFPLTVEDYVHRIGRTGRAGKEGLAITLFTEHDKAQSGA